jgi:hypothetical protein
LTSVSFDHVRSTHHRLGVAAKRAVERLCPMLDRNDPVVLIAMFALMVHADSRPGGAPGLFQRLFVGTGMLWMILISARIYRLELERSNRPRHLTSRSATL